MSEILIRLGVLALVGIAAWLLVWAGRRFVEAQRHLALSTITPTSLASSADSPLASSTAAAIRILAFSSSDCRQCHQLQTPALQRVLDARGETVRVVEVDAPSERQLVEAYHVLTVPSTVVLDGAGKARAVNYGFANTQLLLQQVDEVLAQFN